VREPIVSPQQVMMQLDTLAGATPRSISRRWFCRTEKTLLPALGTPARHAPMSLVPSV
jgi:hypothetical protein